jgi:hypothetical protein
MMSRACMSDTAMAPSMMPSASASRIARSPASRMISMSSARLLGSAVKT